MTKENLVVGAGICGLCLAHLRSKDEKLNVVESHQRVGGLARSYRYNGFTFDIGPHRFHTNDKEVEKFLIDIIDEDIEYIYRKSGVHLNGVYHDWPIKPKTILKLPPKVILNVGLDFLKSSKKNVETFEDYILSKYGQTLYGIFFKPYTEKFTLTDPAQIHPMWAKTGIDRAVIDERQSMDSLFGLVKNTFLKSNIKSKFIYCKGGIDLFSEKLAKSIRSKGSEIFTQSPVDKITVEDDLITSIEAGGKTFNPKHVFWTAPITTLAKLLNLKLPDLTYLSTIIYNIEVDGELDSPYQWCYFRDDEISFIRTSKPDLFSKSVVPEGKSSICVEVTCIEGDETWNNSDSLVEPIKQSLDSVSLAPMDRIENVHVEKIPQSYPLYKINYLQELEEVTKEISKIKNITLLGRSGKFWYNNMDHSIKDALNSYKHDKI